ncbi:MAG: 50S ribosome-binding GTPase [Methanogenium sp.]|nr:50S ribosome-binding GTPase [Methanogenium sp.]
MAEKTESNNSNNKISKILMVGNPNVGKSALFNRLTGANAVVSNYQGTTVDFTRGSLIYEGTEYNIIDVPGTYSLEARDMAEDVAIKMLKEHKDATAIIVLDATKIERGLYLTLEIIELGLPVLIAVNMMDAARDKNIEIDIYELQRILGVPVVPIVAISGEGLKELIAMIRKAQVVNIEMVQNRLKGRDEEPVISGCGSCGKCGVFNR